jgi:hypothetical protein
LRRRSTVAASAANLRQNLSFRLKRPSGRRDCPTGPLGSNGCPRAQPRRSWQSPISHCTSFVQPRSVPADPSAVILQCQLGNFMIVIPRDPPRHSPARANATERLAMPHHGANTISLAPALCCRPSGCEWRNRGTMRT